MTVSLSLHANQAWLTRYTHLQQPYEAVHQLDRTYFIVCVWYYDMHTTHKWDVTNTLCMLSTTWLSLCTHIYNTPFRYACGTRFAHYSWTSCDLHSLRCMNVNRLSLVICDIACPYIIVRVDKLFVIEVVIINWVTNTHRSLYSMFVL